MAEFSAYHRTVLASPSSMRLSKRPCMACSFSRRSRLRQRMYVSAVPSGHAVLGMIGGHVADSVNRRKLLVFTQFGMMVIALVMAAAAYFHFADRWVLLGLCLAQGIVTAQNSTDTLDAQLRLNTTDMITTGAVDPGTHSFREFPAWWQANKDRFHNKRIAMFCTGGIRCEKSTNYLMSQGVTDVFHLQGGILKYLEDVAPDQSLWQGECFVFDERVSVGHGLIPGDFTACRACGRPLSDADRSSTLYEHGVRCPHCATEHTDADRARFRERQHQMDLAAARGQRHLGDPD